MSDPSGWEDSASSRQSKRWSPRGFYSWGDIQHCVRAWKGAVFAGPEVGLDSPGEAGGGRACPSTLGRLQAGCGEPALLPVLEALVEVLTQH